MGSSLIGALNTDRVYKFHNFQPISGHMWETIQDRAIVLRNSRRKSYVHMYRDISDDLEWPLKVI